MTEQIAKAKIKHAEIDAIVIRCGCGKPHSHLTTPCPKGVLEDLGTVSFWHRNPLKRAAWKINQLIKRVKKWQQS